MPSFDEQIRKRKRHDALHLSRAVRSLAGAVTREEVLESGMHLDDAEDAGLQDLCRFFGLPDKDLPSELATIDEKMDYLLESRGVMRRRVSLEGDWWRDMSGPVLATRASDGAHLPLFQDLRGRYYYKDRARSRDVRIDRTVAAGFEREGLCFYLQLPSRALTSRDLLLFALKCPSAWDWGVVLACTLLITLFSMIGPAVTGLIFSSVIPAGSDLRLASTAVLLVSMAVGTWLAGTFQATCNARVTQKVAFGVSAAAFARMLSMPTGFFKPYGSGEMANRLTAMQTLANTLMGALLNGGLTTAFSLLYLVQITSLAPSMMVPAVVAIAGQLVVSVLLVVSQKRMQQRVAISGARLSGTVFSLFSGVQKVKLAGAESRAFHRWADSYQDLAAARFAPPVSMLVLSALSPAVAILGSAVIYAAGANSLTLSSYMAFQASYGMCASAIMGLSSIAGQLAGVGPTLDLARPLLEAVPETSGEREAVSSLTGRIEVSNLSFRYTDQGPWILDDIDLSIEPGSYVALVGTTGCGKSTLLRLLLGFETPEAGAVFYDGQDLARLDVRSLRRHIGCVLQDGRLFQGSIFNNITICAPQKTQAVAWEAAEIAQIAEDIRAMPMGMHTDVTGGGVSGGQRQRILIARAVAAKPSVLIFDEATSALDNITQAKVSAALDAMDCTRIVVAHRLSTIRNCDRIVVLDGGHVAEDGSYEELLAKEGIFAQLVARQRP